MVLSGAAAAQNPQPSPPHETAPTVAPPNAPQPPPERIAPQGNLSEQLSRQQGMLRPPAMDPGIHAPLPPQQRSGAMPVIPPPGSPGGDQRVVPK